MQRDDLIARLVSAHKQRRENSSRAVVGYADSESTEEGSSINFASELQTVRPVPREHLDGLGRAHDLVRPSSSRCSRGIGRTVCSSVAKFMPPPSSDDKENLYQRREDRALRDKEELRRRQERAVAQECTFHPTLSPTTVELAHRRREARGEPDDVGERLFAEARYRVEERDHGLRLPVDHPTTAAVDRFVLNRRDGIASIEHKPIHERLGDLQRDRGLRLQELRAQLVAIDSVELTFTPRIESKSRDLANKRNEMMQTRQLDFSSRLAHEGKLIECKRQLLVIEADRRVAVARREPRPCAGTEVLSSPLLDASFQDRQRMYGFRRLAEGERLRRVEETAEEEWFRPMVSESTTAIVRRSAPHLLSETLEEKAIRMSYVAQCDRERAVRDAEREMYGGLSFAPTIDPLSRRLVPKSSLLELVNNHRGWRHRDQLLQKAEKDFKSQCTFSPQINTDYFHDLSSFGAHRGGIDKCSFECRGSAETECGLAMLHHSMANSTSITTPYTRDNLYLNHPEELMQRIEQTRREALKRRSTLLEEDRLRELQECSFRPKVKPAPKNVDRPIVIRGLDRFMQLKNLTAQLQEEQRRREREAFEVVRVDEFRRPEDQSTIVQPFRFHESLHRPSTAVGQLLASESANLSFRPHIFHAT